MSKMRIRLLEFANERSGATDEEVFALATELADLALEELRERYEIGAYRRSAESVLEEIGNLTVNNPLGSREAIVARLERSFAVTATMSRMGAIPRIPRLPWDAHWMLEAHVAATRSTCDRGPELLLDPGRHGVGAVFVRDKRVVSGGFNGSPPGEPHCDVFECTYCDEEFPASDPRFVKSGGCPSCGSPSGLLGGHLIRDGHCVRTLHAEENALLQCAMDGVSPAGATVYTTASPCWDCAKRLVRVGVSRLVYGADYQSRYGLSDDARHLLDRAKIPVEHLDLRRLL